MSKATNPAGTFKQENEGRRLLVHLPGLGNAELEFDRLTREKSTSWCDREEAPFVAQISVNLGYGEPMMINRKQYRARFMLWIRDPAGGFYAERPHHSGEDHLEIDRADGKSVWGHRVTDAASDKLWEARHLLVELINEGFQWEMLCREEETEAIQREPTDPIGGAACAKDNPLSNAIGELVARGLADRVQETETTASKAMEDLAKLGAVTMAIRSKVRKLKKRDQREGAANNLAFLLQHREIEDALGGRFSYEIGPMAKLAEAGKGLHPEIWEEGHTGGGCHSIVPLLPEERRTELILE